MTSPLYLDQIRLFQNQSIKNIHFIRERQRTNFPLHKTTQLCISFAIFNTNSIVGTSFQIIGTDTMYYILTLSADNNKHHL